jgi:hypothetical protein
LINTGWRGRRDIAARRKKKPARRLADLELHASMIWAEISCKQPVDPASHSL